MGSLKRRVLTLVDPITFCTVWQEPVLDSTHQRNCIICKKGWYDIGPRVMERGWRVKQTEGPSILGGKTQHHNRQTILTITTGPHLFYVCHYFNLIQSDVYGFKLP